MTEERMMALVRSACAGFAEGLMYAITRVDDWGDIHSRVKPCDESGDVDAQAPYAAVPHSEQRDGSFHANERSDSHSQVNPEELAHVVSQMTEPVPVGFFDPMDSREEMTPWMRTLAGIPSGSGA